MIWDRGAGFRKAIRTSYSKDSDLQLKGQKLKGRWISFGC